MEVQFTADVQAKLDQLSGETGRTQDEFVRDALAGYFDELAQIRTVLDSRYDDLKSGRRTLVPAEDVRAYFENRSAARRS